MKAIDLLEAAGRAGAAPPIPDDPARRRSIREAAGVSQQLAAIAVGCSVPALHRWESAPKGPRRALHQERYARVLAALASYAELVEQISGRAAAEAAP